MDGLLTTPQAVAQFLRGYADAGCDEIALFPAVAESRADRAAGRGDRGAEQRDVPGGVG